MKMVNYHRHAKEGNHHEMFSGLDAVDMINWVVVYRNISDLHTYVNTWTEIVGLVNDNYDIIY